jgi:hypothetical protein
MIVDDLDIPWTIGRPNEADAELIVDSDAVLAGTIARERFQPVSRGYAQVGQLRGTVQHGELSHRDGFDVYEPPDSLADKECLRVGAFERANGHVEQ